MDRKLLDNKIFTSEKGLKVWMWCLLKACHEPQEFYLNKQTIKLLPGQFVFGRLKASEELMMSASTVRNYMTLLKQDRYLDIKTYNKYSVITILKWNEYQNKDSKNDNRITSEKHQNNTYNNDNNVNNILYKHNSNKVARKVNPVNALVGEIVSFYKEKTNSDGSFTRYVRDVRELVSLAKRDFPEKDIAFWKEEIIGRINAVARHYERQNLNWSSSLTIKKWKECLKYE